MKNGDYTIIYEGRLYRFPTEQEMNEFLQEQEDAPEEEES